jgi:hypothetical protein
MTTSTTTLSTAERRRGELMADPRMDALLAYATAEMGASQPSGAGVPAALSHRISALANRVSALERVHAEPLVTQTAGVPTFTPPAMPWAPMRLDTTANRVWFWTPIGWRATAALTT